MAENPRALRSRTHAMAESCRREYTDPDDRYWTTIGEIEALIELDLIAELERKAAMPDQFIAVYDSPYTGPSVAFFDERGLFPSGHFGVLWSRPGCVPQMARDALAYFSGTVGITEVCDFL